MKHIVLTERDYQIIDFLTKYKCATTTTIADIFFNGSKRPCTRRLKNLREHHFINSSQEYVSLEQIHYIGAKPTQLRHSCILSELMSKLKDKKILKSLPEYKLGNIRADALLILEDNGTKIYFVEVCNTKPFDINKYHKLYSSGVWKQKLPTFPTILVISDKEVSKSNTFNIITCKTNFTDFNLG